jgi:hypothetical protein
MRLVLRLVETGVEGVVRSVDVLEIVPPGDLGDLGDLGLSLMDGKQLVAQVQQAVVAAQSRDHAARRPTCRSCGTPCQVKDYRPHRIATVFGQITLRLARFRCARCGIGRRPVSIGRRIAARHPSSTSSGCTCRCSCRIGSLRSYWNIFCRLMPEAGGSEPSAAFP